MYTTISFLTFNGTKQVRIPSNTAELTFKGLEVLDAPSTGTSVANRDYVQSVIGSGANLSLSNLTTTSINQDLLPGGSHNIGSSLLKWTSLHVTDINSSTSVQVGTDGAAELVLSKASATTPSGNAVGASIVASLDLGIYSPNDAAVDAVATKSMIINTGNKTAGTGDSGSILVKTGTSVGGARGTLNIGNDTYPQTDNTYNMGDNTRRFSNVWGDFLSASSSIGLRDTAGNPVLTSAIFGPAFGLYTGPFISSPVDFSTYNSYGLRGRSNNSGDANGTHNLVMFTGNKDTGTGNTGSIIMRTGNLTSGATGTKGNISIQAPTDFTSQVITGVTTPIASDSPVPKGYLDAKIFDGSQIRLLNNQSLRARNAADSADFNLFKVDSSDGFVLQKSINAESLTDANSYSLGDLIPFNGIRSTKFAGSSASYSFTGDFSTSSANITNVVGTMPNWTAGGYYSVYVEGYTPFVSSITFTSPTVFAMDSGAFALKNGTGVTFYVLPITGLVTENQTNNSGIVLIRSGNSANKSSGDIILAAGDVGAETHSFADFQGIRYTVSPFGIVGDIYSVQNLIDASLVPQNTGPVVQNSVYVIISGTTGDFSNVGGLVNPAPNTVFRATNNNTPTNYGDYSIQKLILAGTGSIRLINRITATTTRDQLLAGVVATFNVTHDFTATTLGGSNVTQTNGVGVCGGSIHEGVVGIGSGNGTNRITMGAPYTNFDTADGNNNVYLTSEYRFGVNNTSTMNMFSGEAGGTGATGGLNLRSGDNNGSGSTGTVNIRSGVVRAAANSGGLSLQTGNTQALATANSGGITMSSGSVNGTAGSSGGLTVTSGSIAATASATSASGANNLSTGTVNVLTSTTSSGGAQIFSGTNATNSTGGTGIAAVTSGNLTGTGSGTTGTITVRSGNVTNASATSNSGPTQIRTGTNAGSGVSGTMTVDTGSTVSGTSGSLTLASGANTVTGGTGSLNIQVGTFSGTTGSGTGAVNMRAGDINNAAASGNTGAFNIRSGNNSGTGNSGIVDIRSGTTVSGSSSGVALASGTSTSGNTGQLSLNTGNTGASGTSGNIEFASGNSVNNTSGYLHMYTGQVSGTGNSGDSFISTGGTQSGNSGSSSHTTGSSVSGSSGSLNVQSGSTTNGPTGNVNVSSGVVNGTATVTTGQLTLSSGGMTNGSATASTGLVQLFSGNVTAGGGQSGDTNVYTGNAVNGNSGSSQIHTGNSTNAGSGGVSIYTGNTNGVGLTGPIYIGSGYIFGSGNSGQAQLVSGGVTTGSGTSGFVQSKSGDTVNGNSGPTFINTGNASGTGNSGDITVANGTVQANHNSGNITLSTATTSGSGGGGNITVNANSIGSNVGINANGLGGSVSLAANTAGGTIQLSAANNVNMNAPTLVIGSNYQVAFFNTANTQSTVLKAQPGATTSTTFFLPQADGASGQSVVTNAAGVLSFASRLPTAGGTMTGVINMGSFGITNAANPVNPQDLVTKAYTDAYVNGLGIRGTVKAATTAALPAYGASGNILTATSNGALPAQDGFTLSVGQRLLVKNETGGTKKYNGIYDVTAVGNGGAPFVLTRSDDYDGSPITEVKAGSYTFVENGTLAQAHGYVQILTVNTINTDDLEFAQFSAAGSYTAGNGMKITGQVLAVDYGRDLTSNEGSASIVLRDFVYMNTAGGVKLVIADGTIASLGSATQFGISRTGSSVGPAATANITFKDGDIIGGFAGLTVNSPVYASRTVSGGFQQDLTGFVSGNQVIRLGHAISATEIHFSPVFEFEY